MLYSRRSGNNWQTTELIRWVQRGKWEEETEQLRSKEGYKRMKRENKSDHDPKWKSKNVLWIFCFYIWDRQEEAWAGSVQGCWCITVSRERARAFRYQSVNQTQSPWIHTFIHTHKCTHLFLKIEAACQGEIQLSLLKMESILNVSAYLSTYSICIQVVHWAVSYCSSLHHLTKYCIGENTVHN